MLMGLGADSRGWFLQRRALGARYRLILVDNRGMGLSDRPAGPYTLMQMADDALACMEAAGYRSAHIVGTSMGGLLAQLIAVSHPEKVRSLVLAGTACSHQRWRRELLEEWVEHARADGMRSLVRNNLRWMVGPRSLRRVWPAIQVLGPLMVDAPSEAFIAQVQALLTGDDDLRAALPALDVPTLIMVGSQDVLTPRGDSEELASLIRGSELTVVRGGAHLFMVEHASTFNRLVLQFLDGVAGKTTAVPAAHIDLTDSATAWPELRQVAGGR